MDGSRLWVIHFIMTADMPNHSGQCRSMIGFFIHELQRQQEKRDSIWWFMSLFAQGNSVETSLQTNTEI
jgi:hypothetical protein